MRIGILAAALVGVALAAPAGAQLLGRGLGPVLQPPLQALQPLTGRAGALTSEITGDLDPQRLLDRRADRLAGLVRAHPQALELDGRGEPVVRGVVLAVSPSDAALATAQKAGFSVDSRQAIEGADMTLVALRAPPGLSAEAAVKRLRKLDPAGSYDFDHIYSASGRANATTSAARIEGSGRVPGSGVRVGLVDTGVDTAHPALAAAHVEQRAFAPGGLVRQGHGTATASLIVGDAGAFHGAAPGAMLLAADVYGAAPTGGAGDMLVRALGWLAVNRVQVVNISLVGPQNLALGAAIRALQTRGILVVAAVGNDGPAAPPAYPASYPGVIAVTGVDAHGRVLLEAGRASHLDFAAPGADMAAAWTGGRWAAVRGTSFAAPIVAGRLAALAARSRGAAVEALASSAKHGRGYGKGLVGMDLRVPPASVGAVEVAQ